MKFLIFIIVIFIQFNLAAQQPVKSVVKPKNTLSTPAKRVNVVASFGNKTGGDISVAEAKILIDNKLILKDENGAVYPVGSCKFLYKRKMSFQDENTGEIKSSFEYIEKEFNNKSQLDDTWKNTLKSDLQKGESLIFEKIFADSQKGYFILVKGITFNIK